MSNFILAGLFTEGATDNRFLNSIIKKTLDDILFDSIGDIETELIDINIDKTNLNFNQQVFNASKSAKNNFGVQILFIHTDAGGINDEHIFNTKIIPSKLFLENQNDDLLCKTIVAIVPIQTTEAWMIADKSLLKEEIGIEGTDLELGIHKTPEQISNPKAVIENIIRLSKENQTKRKRKSGLVISDLYQIIGKTIEISKLEKLESYIKFKNNLKDILIELNYMKT